MSKTTQGKSLFGQNNLQSSDSDKYVTDIRAFGSLQSPIFTPRYVV